MTTLRVVARAGLALLASAVIVTRAAAQSWRPSAAGIGTTARVLIIGTRPEDEDNALIAWLSLGRHVETAYLSLTRGEAGVNVAGNERQSALGVVRTAELLAERERDGAHQYFTRAYDFGFTRLDSVVDAGWPHDSLMHDVVSVVRAFRPHVIISLFSDSADRDATHRLAARLAREAFSLAGDSIRLPSSATALLPAWTVPRLLTRLDSAPHGQTPLVSIDVGEFDRASGHSFAELGAEIRRLQRTQHPVASPSLGPLVRTFRLDGARSEGHDTDLFGDVDTSLVRFRGDVPDSVRASFDSLTATLAVVHGMAPAAAADSIVPLLATAAAKVTRVRAAFRCRDISGVAACPGSTGDLVASLATIRDRVSNAIADAANIVVDGTVERALVAKGDSVPATITVFNGGTLPFTIRQLSATSRTSSASLVYTPPFPRPDSAPPTPVVVAPDSIRRWMTSLQVRATDYHWWQFHGLQRGTWLHEFVAPPIRPVIPQLISGEDRIPSSGVEAMIQIAGAEIRVIKTPLAMRSPGIVRGDDRHPLTGVPAISVLANHVAEYERANLPIDGGTLVRVSSTRTSTDTVVVELTPPAGLRVDTAKRSVVLPPYGAVNVMFRLQGKVKPGRDSIVAVAHLLLPITNVNPRGGRPAYQDSTFDLGGIVRDYPHIPSQTYVRTSTDRVEIVDLHTPARLHVAYVQGTDDMQPQLAQLQINVQTLDPALIGVVDLSGFTTVLIGSGALEGGALAAALPALRDFMRKGGTVVIMPGGEEVASSGLLPYPIVFDSIPTRLADPAGELHAINAKSPFLTWPNTITADDFTEWTGERARDVPMGYDLRYRTVLSANDPGQDPTAATILSAPVGKGLVIYSALSLDRQLAAVHPGAAKLFANLLSAGLKGAPPKK
ncbi:MAG: PIG-L family deacetylase [Gemmatimonadaceae bacterium]